jgi:hypothetical protein
MPPPNGQRGDRHAAQARRARVAELYAAGFSTRRIAARCGVSQPQIIRDLHIVRAEWKRVMAEEYERLRCEQLAKIDVTEREAWRGWRRSLRTSQKRYAKLFRDGNGQRQESGQTEEGQAGDPRFLQAVLRCIEQRLRLIGGYPDPDQPPAPMELVVRRLGPGLSMADLHGGQVLTAQTKNPTTNG